MKYVLRKYFKFVDTDCPGGYKCNNGRCVGSDALCNEMDDCLDFSDEDNCGRRQYCGLITFVVINFRGSMENDLFIGM